MGTTATQRGVKHYESQSFSRSSICCPVRALTPRLLLKTNTSCFNCCCLSPGNPSLPHTGVHQGAVLVAPSHHDVFNVGSSAGLGAGTASTEQEHSEPFESGHNDGRKSDNTILGSSTANKRAEGKENLQTTEIITKASTESESNSHQFGGFR